MSTQDMVTVTVVKGSVSTWKDGAYSFGESFTISREEAEKIDPSFVLIEKAIPTHRPMVEAVKQCFGDAKIRGAEIGVYKAVNAEDILKTLNLEELHLVDAYLPYQDSLDGTTTDFSGSRVEAEQKMSVYPQVVWHIKSSVEAAKEIDDCSLDFVYIDGNHTYESCKQDIDTYYPKLKPLGIIGGHDYHATSIQGIETCPGVSQAVDEFAEKNGYAVHSEFAGKNVNVRIFDWWINLDEKTKTEEPTITSTGPIIAEVALPKVEVVKPTVKSRRKKA